jgi:hypothetical protein
MRMNLALFMMNICILLMVAAHDSCCYTKEEAGEVSGEVLSSYIFV